MYSKAVKLSWRTLPACKLHAPLPESAPHNAFRISFLNDLDRIIQPDYQPSDSDIVRARLRTTGVQEHHFQLDRGMHVAIRSIAEELIVLGALQGTIHRRPIGSFTMLQVNNFHFYIHIDC